MWPLGRGFIGFIGGWFTDRVLHRAVYVIVVIAGGLLFKMQGPTEG